MTRMTRPDCAVMCNLIKTHTHTHTHTHTNTTINTTFNSAILEDFTRLLIRLYLLRRGGAPIRIIHRTL